MALAGIMSCLLYTSTGALIPAGTAEGLNQAVVRLAQSDVLRLRMPVPCLLYTSDDAVRAGGQRPVIHPDDAEKYNAMFSDAVKDHTSFSAEARVRRADGEWRLVGSKAEPRDVYKRQVRRLFVRQLLEHALDDVDPFEDCVDPCRCDGKAVRAKFIQ